MHLAQEASMSFNCHAIINRMVILIAKNEPHQTRAILRLAEQFTEDELP